MRRTRTRRERGSVVALAFVALCPLIAAIGGFAVDCMHFNDERGALQRATDAGALAGAQDLYSFVGTKNWTATTQDPANEEPVNFALAVTKVNIVDGRPVVTDTSGGSITVTASIPDHASSTPMPKKCQVDATMNIHSIFSMIFGNFGQTVGTHSVAAATTTLNQMYTGGMFPLALSFTDLQPGGAAALGTLTAGLTPFTFQIGTNALWGGVSPVSASSVSNAENSFINHTGSGGSKPIKIGQSVPTSNGTMGGCEQTLGSLPAGTMLICPLIESISNPTCVGFIAFKTGAPSAGPWGGAIFNGQLMASGTTVVSVGATTGEYDENSDSEHKTFIQQGKVVAVHLIE